MLTEIIEIAKFGKELIDSKNAKVKGWRKFYDMYCKLDEVINSSVLVVEHYLPVPLDSEFLVSTTRFKSPIDKWVYYTNHDFKTLDKAVKEYLESFRELEGILEIYDRDLKEKLEYHFWVKSLWCKIFAQIFCSGEISSDGKKLRKKALRLAEHIDKSWYERSMADIKALIISEEIDISEDELRMHVVEMGKKNIVALRQIKAHLGKYIKKNCRVEDLL